MCEIRYQMSKDYMMHQKLFPSEGRGEGGLSFVCVLGMHKFVGDKTDYFLCPKTLACAFSAV